MAKRERSASHEVDELRNKLELAMEAEENNKQAMEQLAVVIKEVAAEANKAKEEAARLKAVLSIKEGALREAEKEMERLSNTIDELQAEAEESVVAWSGKEIEFIKLIKEEEDEKESVTAEKRKLDEALTELGQKSNTLRAESERLASVFNEALEEADVAREANEEAKAENLHLRASLAERERRLAILTQDVERLSVYEAAAHDNIRRLNTGTQEVVKKPVPTESEEEQKKANSTTTSMTTATTEDKVVERRMIPSFSKRLLLPSFTRKDMKPPHAKKEHVVRSYSILPLLTYKSKAEVEVVGEASDSGLGLGDDDIKDSIFDALDSLPRLEKPKHRRTLSSPPVNEDKSGSLEEFEALGSPHCDDMEVDRGSSHSTKKKVLLWRFSALMKRKSHQSHNLHHKELTT